MYTDYYSQQIYNYLRDYIYPILTAINNNLGTLNTNFNSFVINTFPNLVGKVDQILFWVAFLVFLYIGYKFLRIRSRTL